MKHQIELHTERLILKNITPQLIHHLFSTKSKEELVKYFGLDESGYTHYLEMHKKGMETHRISMSYFLLINRSNNTPIGECGFHNWNIPHQRAELFYLLRNDSSKQQGFMSEALPSILDYGFDRLNLHRIEALVADWNIPSIKLLLKNRFTKEGTMREDYVVRGKHEDSDCYSLLKREWQSHF